jgi:hypothetical protein
MARQSDSWRVESLRRALRHRLELGGRLTDALARAERARKRFAEFDYIPQGDRPDWEAREGAKPRDMGPSTSTRTSSAGSIGCATTPRRPACRCTSPWRPLRDKKCFKRPRVHGRLAGLAGATSRDGGRRFRLLWHTTLIAPAARLGDKYDHLNYTAKKTAFTPWFAARLRAALSGSDEGAPRGEFWDPFADAPVRPPE